MALNQWSASESPAASLTSLPQGSLLGFQQAKVESSTGITSCSDPLPGWLYCIYRLHLDFCLQSSLTYNTGRANSFTCHLCHYYSYLMTLINSCVHHFLCCDMESISPPWNVTRDWRTSTSFQQPLLAPCIRGLLRTPVHLNPQGARPRAKHSFQAIGCVCQHPPNWRQTSSTLPGEH